MKWIPIVLFFALACTTKPEVPDDVLPPEKMQAVMLDLIHVDGYIANAASSDSLLKRAESRRRIYSQVFALHGTNKEKFTHSLKYYEQHPTLLKEVVEAMDKTLTKQVTDTANTGANRRRPLAL